MSQMLRKEACSGQLEDLAHVVSVDCFIVCLTKASAKYDALAKVVSTCFRKHLDMRPPFITPETQGLSDTVGSQLL